jgi:uncharacterized repeat protein (TIGR02543 family)
MKKSKLLFLGMAVLALAFTLAGCGKVFVIHPDGDEQSETYTVSYSGNGKTGGNAPQQRTYEDGEQVTILSNTGNLERTGYTFTGWNTAGDGSGISYQPGEQFTINADTPLFARWTPDYLPTHPFIYNDAGKTGGNTPPQQRYEDGEQATVLGNTGDLVKNGYTFTGWNTAPDGNGTSYQPGEQFDIIAVTTLYAQWISNDIQTYTLTYNRNNATGGDVPAKQQIYTDGAQVTVLGNTRNLVRTGYAFNGWNTAASGNGTDRPAGSAFSIAGNTTLYAKWSVSSLEPEPDLAYTVTYDGNGNTGGAAPSDSNSPYAANKVVTVLGNIGGLEKTGYTFAGWNTAPGGDGTPYEPGGQFVINAAMYFYAQWTEGQANEGGETLDELLTAGTDSLLDEAYDSAMASYEKAYLKAPNEPKAVVYSSLSKLASIAVDSKVKTLFQEHLGVDHYPGTLQSLISGNWLAEYHDEYFQTGYYDYQSGYYCSWYGPHPDGHGGSWMPDEITMPGYYYNNGYYDEIAGGWVNNYTLVSTTPIYGSDGYSTLPGLSVPDWLKETQGYQDELTSTGLESPTTWTMTLFANLLDKNITGLNNLFDDILNSVFGESFEEAARRVGTLDYADSIVLERAVVDKFGLDDLFEGDTVYLGRAELDLVIASLRILKASLEWLASYDWTTDLSFLKADWTNEEGIMDKLTTIDVNGLPFRNNFLKARYNGMMDKARDDYLSAIRAAYNAYDHIGDKGNFPDAAKDFLEDYRWIKNGLLTLEAAIEQGTVFYIPEEEPSGDTWPTTAANTLFGIDMGKFFTPGFFSPENIFELRSSGIPEFYGYTGERRYWDGGSYVTDPEKQGKIESLADFADYESFGFALNTEYLKELVKGLDPDIEEEFSHLYFFPRNLAEILYKRYNGL